MNKHNVYVLDTNIISYFLKKTGGIDKAIQAALVRGDLIIIAPGAYYEVKRGLLYVGALKRIQIFENLCTRFGVGDLDKQVLSSAAEIYADLRAKGKLVEDVDILVGAYCVSNKYTLVTHNIKHFTDIEGLDVVDWFEE